MTLADVDRITEEQDKAASDMAASHDIADDDEADAPGEEEEDDEADAPGEEEEEIMYE